MKEDRSPAIDYTDAFSLIAEMAREFSQGRDFDDTLARALESIVSHVEAEAGSLWISDDALGDLTCVASVGTSPITGMRLPIAEGIIGRSVRQNTCQTVFDVSRDPDFSEKMDRASGFETHSILCSPMSFSDEVIGALQLINKRTGSGRFNQRDADMLQILAASAGLAISNQRLAAAQVEAERAHRELEVAREIQLSMLPKMSPTHPGREEISIFATLAAAREVGGDFYEFFPIDDDRFCFSVGDVSGKGTPAALFMAVTTTLLKAIARDESSPAKIVQRMNAELAENNDSCMFVSAFVGILDPGRGRLVYANAGHPPPYLKRADRSVERIEARHGPVLGAREGLVYTEDTLQLSAGDVLLLYTDGVTEATDRSEGLFSEERLARLLAARDYATVEDLVEAVSAGVAEFERGTAQADDVTILALRLNG